MTRSVKQPRAAKRAARATGGKFTPALKQELLEAKLARARERGGSTLAAVYYHQLRRFLAGAKPPPGSPEEAVFRGLAKRDRDPLRSHLSHWDKLPAAARRTLLGPAAGRLAPDRALTAELGRDLVRSIGKPRRRRRAARTSAEPITQIQVRQIECVDPTPEIGKDDILVHYLIVSGDVVFDKITGVYKFKRPNETQAFRAADVNLWAPPDGGPVRHDVEIFANLIEDDSADIAALFSVLSSAVPVTAPVVELYGGVELPEGIEEDAQGLLDAIAAALPQSDLIGTDFVRVFAEGRFSKTAMTATQFKKNGKVRARYVLKNFNLVPPQANADGLIL